MGETRAQSVGTLMLFGGGERDSNDILWREFVAKAGGKGATIAIFPTASSFPERTGELFAQHMRQLGLEPFVVPLAPQLKGTDLQSVLRDEGWITRVRNAKGVFLAGGEQQRYRKTLVEADGQETEMLKSIRSVYENGGLVAGTSAGTAIMSRMMFIDAEKILPVLVHGTTVGKEVDHGLGLFPHDWFVDQHFLTRGRFGRTLVAMKTFSFPFGIGIDEDTALILEEGKRIRVAGYRGAVVLDAREATSQPSETRFHWNRLRLHYMSHGDSMELDNLKITPAKEKRDQDKVDPTSPDFKPYYLLKQFYNDIFANTQLLDLMYKLVDGPHEDAIGLTFDGDEARSSETPGFEFRFYRGGDTVSWDSPIAVGDAYTVLNVYLDIKPIVIKGPLYQP